MTSRFLFDESPRLGVYTTRQVWEQGLPILLVTHDPNGDWQFLCGTRTDTADGLVIHLAHIVERCPDVHELADLPRSWYATRESTEAPWVRAPQPPEWVEEA